MQVIHKVIVGSRLHNLYNEQSDYDYRGVFVHSLYDYLNPFEKVKNTSWIEGEEDNTSYELGEFCKFATHGNPTILEILYSNKVTESTEWGKKLVENRHKFLHSHHIFEAHKGYASNQYNKMNLFDPDLRTPKFAVAYIRSLHQGIQLLKTGEFSPQVEGKLREYLMQIKYDFSVDKIPNLSRTFQEMQLELHQAYIDNRDKFMPDYVWIRKFVYDCYKGND